MITLSLHECECTEYQNIRQQLNQFDQRGDLDVHVDFKFVCLNYDEAWK